MIAYCDASVLALIVLQDAGWQQLARWIDSAPAEAGFSDFGWGELISAVSLRVRRGLLTVEVGRRLILDAGAYTCDWSAAPMTTADLTSATDIVADFDLGLKLPDAIHIAIAKRLNALLVTADRRQARVADHLGLSVYNPTEDLI